MRNQGPWGPDLKLLGVADSQVGRQQLVFYPLPPVASLASLPVFGLERDLRVQVWRVG